MALKLRKGGIGVGKVGRVQEKVGKVKVYAILKIRRTEKYDWHYANYVYYLK